MSSKAYRGAKWSGFALPTVLITSVAMMVILLAALQASTSTSSTLNSLYYTQLAQEAAESGLNAASMCITNNYNTATWTGPLSPKTDCTGATVASQNQYILSNSTVRTTFSVPVVTLVNNFYVVQSTGKTQLLSSTTGSVQKEYSQNMTRRINTQSTMATDFGSGTRASCAVISGVAYCWGATTDGRLGIGTTSDPQILQPAQVARQTGVLEGKIDTRIASGVSSGCVVSNARVYCWGLNDYGKLGNTSVAIGAVSTVPIAATLNSDVKDVVMGADHTCALTVAGDVYCWGRNNYGQLGNGGTTDSQTPVRVINIGAWTGKPVTSIETSLYGASTCAIVTTTTGTSPRAWCWGHNDAGQLGDNTTTDRLGPVAVGGLLAAKDVTSITVAAYGDGIADGVARLNEGHACAVAGGAFYCWGAGRYGMLGNGGTGNSAQPVAVIATGVLASTTALQVSAGTAHTCGTARNNTTLAVNAYCWGSNTYGQLGNNAAFGGYASSPVTVYSELGGLQGRTISDVTSGGNRGCVLASAAVFCWGLNADGQLGNGTTDNSSKPVRAVLLGTLLEPITY